MERRRKKTDGGRPAKGGAPRAVRLSFWQKIYLCTLALFLFCLNAGVFAVAAVGQSSSFEAERERLLTRQHFIAETLAQDMAAVEARRPGALPALAQDYALGYGGSGAWLKVTRGGSTLADRLPAPDDAAALPEAEQEGTRAWEVLPAGGRRVLYVSALLPGQGERTALTCAFDMEQFFAAWGAHGQSLSGHCAGSLGRAGGWAAFCAERAWPPAGKAGRGGASDRGRGLYHPYPGGRTG